MGELLTAASLLTILPIRRNLQYTARALAWFPLVGVGLGLALAAAYFLYGLVFPPAVRAGLLVATWALLTGALHLDGVSDACDALMAATTRERRLEILRDVHMGAFGATGLMLVLLCKFAALNSSLLAVIFLAPVLARWAMVLAAAFPLARNDGMAALFAQGLTGRELFWATSITFVCCIPFGMLAVVSWAVALLVTLGISRLAISRLGGLTGDIYGLTCEVTEVAVLLVGAAFT